MMYHALPVLDAPAVEIPDRIIIDLCGKWMGE